MNNSFFRTTTARGFTIIEMLIVVTLLAVLSTIFLTNFGPWKIKIDVTNGMQEFANVVKLAQSKTLSYENTGQYGVYIDTTTTPHSYVLFKGSTYANRDISTDVRYTLPATVEFSSVVLGTSVQNLGGPGLNESDVSGGGSGGSGMGTTGEIVFARLTGLPQISGSVSVRSKIDTAQIQTMYLAASGSISFTNNPTVSDASKIKDARHVYFDYTRIIDTSNESITLSFDNGATVKTFPISSYITSGQINWSEVVSVGGVDQTISIKTIELNSPNTKFNIHRDMRLNTKSVKVTISGDTSGTLAEYTADGSSTNHTSLYVSNFVWQ